MKKERERDSIQLAIKPEKETRSNNSEIGIIGRLHLLEYTKLATENNDGTGDADDYNNLECLVSFYLDNFFIGCPRRRKSDSY